MARIRVRPSCATTHCRYSRACNGHELDALFPVISRRFDTVSRVYRRNGQETLQAALYGEQAFGITALQFEALRAADGRRPLAAAVEELAGWADASQARAALRYLAERGAISLVPERSSIGSKKYAMLPNSRQT